MLMIVLIAFFIYILVHLDSVELFNQSMWFYTMCSFIKRLILIANMSSYVWWVKLKE